jgi:hypothetical protein
MSKKRGTDMARTVEDFAEDLGRPLGTARNKAEGWLGQRNDVAKQLAQIRDAASQILGKLTGGGTKRAAAVRKSRPRRPGGSQNKVVKTKRRMSAAARTRISAAQKARRATVKPGRKN